MQMKEKIGLTTWVHHYQPESKRASVQWKYPSSPSTKKFKVTPSVGKFMLIVSWDSQGVLLAHFQKRGENMNSATYCEIILKLPDAICTRIRGQLARGILLHHDNARPHTARVTQYSIQELQWELFEYTPYSPDFAPSDFHLSGPLRNQLRGQSFNDNEEFETEVRKWLRQLSKHFMLKVSTHR
jgi:histone-lysine N-methyltransferase SETMAR